MSKWEMVRLGDVLEYEQPTKYIVENDRYDEKYSTPVLTAGKTFVLGYTDETENIYTDIPVIIFDDFTTAAKFVDFPFKVKSSAMKILRPTEKINIRYIYFLMTMIKVDTGLHKRYWISKYADIQIPLPPLEEQKKIATELDKISDLIAKRKQQIEKLDVLVKAKFIEMFGDVKTNSFNLNKVNLSQIADVGSSRRVFVEELVEHGVPFYRGTEIGALAENKKVIPELFITKEHYADLISQSGQLCKGDLLMPSICPDGRIWRVDTDESFYFKDGRVLSVKIKNNAVNSLYLQHYLKNKFRVDYEAIASGTTFAELKIFALKALPVFLPDVSLQNYFADYVQQVKQNKEKLEQVLSQLELLYKQRMQYYFE